MSLFFKKDQPKTRSSDTNFNAVVVKAIEESFQSEGIKPDKETIDRFSSSQMYLYRCKNQCATTVSLGKTAERCGMCGGILTPLRTTDGLFDNMKNDLKDNISHFLLFGEALKMIRKDNSSKAEEYLTRALKIKPKDINSLYNRAEVRIHLNDFRGAISDCSKLIELSPSDSDAYVKRALAKMMSEEFAEGVQDATTGIELGTKKTIAWFVRAFCYSQTGEVKRAAADCRKFLHLDPNNPRAKLAKALLTSIDRFEKEL